MRLLVSFVFSLASVSAVAAENRPDVLFIAIDDLNDWIGCLDGHPQASTPNIDELAGRGMLFTNAHCAAPACNPSRAALMTGRAPWRSGVYHNPQPWRLAMPDATTLSQHFMNHGYWAGGSGKIYHGLFPDPDSWVEFYPSLEKQSPPGFRPKNLPLNGIKKTSHFDWGPIAAKPEEMSDYKVASWISGKLLEKSDAPRFLACGIFRPHLPWFAPQQYFDAGATEQDTILPPTKEGDLDDVPAPGLQMAKPDKDHASVLKHNQWKRAVQGYIASIRFADEMVGRVIDALDESGRRDKTIVVLWADHGWHLGEKQHWRKFALWDRATRVPMMMVVPSGLSKSLPDGVKPGSRCDTAVSLLDIYPTLSELCGLQSPKGPIDGKTLVGLLSDPDSQPKRAVVTTHGRGNHAVRSANWRYIQYSDGSEELYDHNLDPNEWVNLAVNATHADTIASLKQHLPTMSAPEARKAKKK